jgi:non-homologous end joining protein Ku
MTDPKLTMEVPAQVREFAEKIIRETIRNMDMAAIGRVVLTSREHIIALEPLDMV